MVQADTPQIAPYTITNARAIEHSLTGHPGDAERGARLFAEAGCAGCHAGGAGAGLSPGEIRLWIVAPRVRAPRTAMPAYHVAGQRRAPEDPLYNGPRLTAGEVEDLVAYLVGRAPPP